MSSNEPNVEQARPADQLLDTLENEIRNGNRIVDELIEVIEPVLLEDPSVDTDGKDAKVAVGTESRICDRIRKTVCMVVDLNDRLEAIKGRVYL